MTIYALEPWSCDSEAVVAKEPTDGGLPEIAAAQGMRYFLEVSVAKELLEGSERRHPFARVNCDRLIGYAKYDA